VELVGQQKESEIEKVWVWGMAVRFMRVLIISPTTAKVATPVEHRGLTTRGLLKDENHEQETGLGLKRILLPLCNLIIHIGVVFTFAVSRAAKQVPQ